jgi:rRNA maturation endonuclease Nob1
MATWKIKKHLDLELLVCSKCYGAINVNKYGDVYKKQFKFCPYCGEEMKEVNENEKSS